MRTADTTFAATKTLTGVDDLIARAQAICAALDAGDTTGATEGQNRLQRFLLQMTPTSLATNERIVLAALLVFPHHRGARVASWLRVHTRDDDARQFWADAEQVLNPLVFGHPGHDGH